MGFLMRYKLEETVVQTLYSDLKNQIKEAHQ